MVATASYDHTVKLWDVRAREAIASFEHEHPVEKLEFFPSGVALVAAVGSGLIIRDVMTGKEIASFANHQKTTTSLCFDGTGERLFSASLDHQVKVYDLEKFQVSHSIKYDAPVLDLAISKENTNLVVGMSDGTLSIRRRENKVDEDEVIEPEKASRFFSGTPRHFQFEPTQADFTVARQSERRLKDYEHLLRKFQYKEALDLVLSKNDPLLVISVFEELIIRQSLQVALAGRNSQELQPILQFLHRYVLNPRYNTHLFMVFHIVLGKESLRRLKSLLTKTSRLVRGRVGQSTFSG